MRTHITPTIRISVVVAMLLSAVLIAGCGSANTSTAGGAAGQAAAAPTSTTKPNLCDVLTVARIQQVIGYPVGPGRPPDPLVGCGWIGQDIGNNSSVTVLYVAQGTYDGARSYGSQTGTTTPVAGLGDDAFVEAGSSQRPLLLIRKGDLRVSVGVVIMIPHTDSSPPGANLAAEKQLGAIVAAAL